MAGRTSQGPALEPDQRALAETYLHPVKAMIVSAVSERPGVTVAEVARRLHQPPRRVRHHLEVLLEEGLIEEVPSVDGGARRFGRGLIRFDEYSAVDAAERVAISREVVRLLLGNVAAAVAAGTFASRHDDRAIRMYGEVDDACMVELATIHERAYHEMLEVIGDWRRQRIAGKGSGTEIVSALFLFEAPLWGPSTAEGPRSQAPRTLSGTRWDEGGERHGIPLVPSSEETGHLVAAIVHPLKGPILNALAERPGVTIREVATRVGEAPRRVRHAIETLLAVGLVLITEESLGRGVLERRYGARPWVIQEGDEIGATERVALSKAVIRLVMGDVGAAAAADRLGAWPDEYKVRIYGEVDEASRTELVEIHRRAYPAILESIEAGRERIRESGEAGTEIVSALFLFEAPLWNGRPITRG